MMSRDELQQHLHAMVDRLFDELPEALLGDGVFPMLRVTFAAKDDDTPAFTLVVGIDRPDQD